ncbi:uncharacterized protein [Dysidea avara]|uniref:uncharacterized protein n=1 Tax=Dysidea avara TaxID=196820 RepID=UPI00331B88C4
MRILYIVMISLSLLLLLSLISHITTRGVYNVRPDDHYTTCHHCHKLQHYLLNTTKYFTSNTQLLFLPGLHHLHTDLIIQNVHNISLIGSTTNGTTPDTVIQCNSSVGIVMTNITNLIVTNITVRSCLGNEYNNATVLIKQCTNVQLRHVVIKESHNSYGLVGINVLGDSQFKYVTSNFLQISYNDTKITIRNRRHHHLSIDRFHNIHSNCSLKNTFRFHQYVHKVIVSLTNSLLNHQTIEINFHNANSGQSIFRAKSCSFTGNYDKRLFIIVSVKKQQDDGVWIENCSIFNHYFYRENSYNRLVELYYGPDIYIINCSFHHIYNTRIIVKRYTKPIRYTQFLTKVFIANTNFSSITGLYNIIDIHASQLQLTGPIIFNNMSMFKCVIGLQTTNITCSNYIEFANINTDYILCYYDETIHYTYFNMFITENSTIRFTQSKVKRFALPIHSKRQNWNQPCYFQYLSDVPLDDTYSYYNYSIVLDNDDKWTEQYAFKDLPITHCKWLPGSAFKTAMPLEVNNKYLMYANKSGKYHDVCQIANCKKLICVCEDTAISHDCKKDLLDPIYPGQTMTLNVYVGDFDVPLEFQTSNNTIITVVNITDWLPSTACVVTNFSELSKTVKNHICTSLKYTIAFPTEGWCELFLKGFRDGISHDITDVYYVKQLPCPIGFIKVNGICQCHSFLYKYNIKCNINDQTLLLPANAWIAPTPHNNSYVYSLSLQCPFHYCLSHSSHLNFSNPNAQCQFNRSGILCGHCQQSLSTVFGSSHCQLCSSIYLFLIVPIAIAGLVLVLLLFILNLTITDGTISAFILYVNIISINTPVFFPESHKLTPTYIFISLANLDLGIQTCFYNVSSLDRSINLLIGIVLFSLMEGIHGAVRPFKKMLKNYHEQILIKNILILFIIALYSQDALNMIAVNWSD